MPPIGGWKTGVYRIRNLVNDKRYIGSAGKSFEERWSVHRAALRGNYHHSKHLQAAWNKYGEKSFVFEVIERCSLHLCLEREQFWLDKERSYDQKRGYNILPTAGNPSGRVVSEETRAKLSAGRLGKRHTAESKAKMSAALKASAGSKIAQAKATIAAARSNIGRKRSQRHRAAISAAHKGIAKTAEHKEKIKATHWSKRPDAAEIAAKIVAKRSQKLTEEHKARIAEAGRRRWARQRGETL